MNVNSPTHKTVAKLVPPLAVWAIGKILDLPSVKRSVKELDGHAEKRKRQAVRTLKRGVQNARSNAVLVAAGAVAIVIGIGLLVRAASD